MSSAKKPNSLETCDKEETTVGIEWEEEERTKEEEHCSMVLHG